MYCTYLTQYFGSLLPRLYLGSSNCDRIEAGYRGSPASKSYKSVWVSEIKTNPHLFKTRILQLFETREEAFEHELALQRKYHVVKSSKYVNLALAKKKGYKGRDVRGVLNPMFGKTRTGEKHHLNTGDNIREGHRRSSKWNSEEFRLERSLRMRGANNPSYGKQHTEEFKTQMSLRMSGSNHPGYGKKRTPEQRAKISETRRKRIAEGLIVPYKPGTKDE